MQLLINIEEEYRSYSEFIAVAIRQARPDDEVVLTQPAVLEEEIERTDPDLVISSPPIPANAVGERVAWVELSLDPAKPFRFRVGERRSESMNYTLYEVPSVVDQAREIAG
jgi:hypothetical protein